MNYTYPQMNPYPSQAFMRYGQNPYQQPAAPQSMPQQVQGYSPASMPVSSKEEAMAAPADFSGAPMVFADFSHGKIYLKQWNNQKGAADFVIFAPEVQAVSEERSATHNEDYITKSDFRKEMEKLYRKLDQLRGGKADENEH